MTTATNEPPVFAAELKSLLGITHSDTLRVHIKKGKIPPPDVRISQKSRYWHRETLRRVGLLPKLEGGAA
jgi:hypothetical protein